MRRLLLVTALALTACVNANPTLYVLTPALLTQRGELDSVIGLREIELPDYARDPRFVRRSEDGSLVHLEEHRWADRPSRAVTRTLMKNLRQLTGARVVGEPYPEGARPNVTVAVSFDVLDGTRGGTVELRARYRVRRGAEEVRFFELSTSEPVEGDSFVAMTDAYARALAALAVHIYEQALR